VAHCAADREAAIARVRGAQAQLLLAGLHTTIDAGELRARLASRDLSAPSVSAARLLRSYVEPGPAAAVAASLTTGRGPGWLARLTHEQLHEGRIATTASQPRCAARCACSSKTIDAAARSSPRPTPTASRSSEPSTWPSATPGCA
jgi:hypothetical protein